MIGLLIPDLVKRHERLGKTTALLSHSKKTGFDLSIFGVVKPRFSYPGGRTFRSSSFSHGLILA